jgi:hypothetical protein
MSALTPQCSASGRPTRRHRDRNNGIMKPGLELSEKTLKRQGSSAQSSPIRGLYSKLSRLSHTSQRTFQAHQHRVVCALLSAVTSRRESRDLDRSFGIEGVEAEESRIGTQRTDKTVGILPGRNHKVSDDCLMSNVSHKRWVFHESVT